MNNVRFGKLASVSLVLNILLISLFPLTSQLNEQVEIRASDENSLGACFDGYTSIDFSIPGGGGWMLEPKSTTWSSSWSGDFVDYVVSPNGTLYFYGRNSKRGKNSFFKANG